MKKILIIPLFILIYLNAYSQLPGACVSGDCKNGDGKFLLKSGDTLIIRFRNEKPISFGRIHYKNGNKYQGYIVSGLPNGNGHMQYADGKQYFGYWNDGKRELSGNMIYPDSTKMYVLFENDLLVGPSSMRLGCLAGNCIEGQGSYIYADGAKYNGQFWGSLKHGRGNFEFTSGIVYMGDWAFDTIQGYGTMRYPNGDYYEGSYNKGLRHGYGTFYDAVNQKYQRGFWLNNEWKEEKILEEENKCVEGNCENGKGKLSFGFYSEYPGCEYDGELKNNLPQGFGTMHLIDGTRVIGYWSEGKYLKKDTLPDRCNSGDCVNGLGLYDWSSGAYYQGFWRNDRRCFYGVNQFSSGSIYRGFWQMDKKNGFGVHTFSNGEKYTGYFKKDLRHGYGEFVFENKNRFVGEFENDSIYGEGVMYYPDGKIERGFWIGDKLTRLQKLGFGCVAGDCWYGYGTYIAKNGDRYIGEWLDSKYSGQGMLFETNGNIYVGEFKEGLKEGYGKQIYNNGERYLGTWKNNFIDGRGIYVYRNDSVLNALWREGKFIVRAPENPDLPKIMWEVPLTTQSATYTGFMKIKFGITSATPLSNVQIYVNEKLVANLVQFDLAAKPLPEYDFTLEKEIKLEVGTNEVKIVAYNDFGEETSEKRTVLFKQNAKSKKQALLIANTYNAEKYAYFAENLNQLETLLIAQNYEIVKLLNPGRSQLEKALREYGENMQLNQVGSFFYFGGLMKQLSSKNYFILGNDSLVTQDDVMLYGIELTRLYDEIRYGGSPDNFVVLDYQVPQYNEILFRLNGEIGLHPAVPPLYTKVYFSMMPGTEIGKSVNINAFMPAFLANQTLNDYQKMFDAAKLSVSKATNMLQIPFYLENSSKY